MCVVSHQTVVIIKVNKRDSGFRWIGYTSYVMLFVLSQN